MRIWLAIPMAAACFVFTVAGCRRASNPAAKISPPASVAKEAKMPAGWKVYTPAEGDFSVAVPADPSLAKKADEKTQKFRIYVFPKGEASLRVMLFTERTGNTAQSDLPEKIKADPEVVAGSVRAISSLGDMEGVEFRAQDPQDGELLIRNYRSPDGSRAISLGVLKPKALLDSEVRMFFESFKLLR